MPRPHVFVTRRIPDEALDILRTACEVHTWDHEEEPVPHDELVRQLQVADGALVVGPHRIDGPLMDAAPRCRIYANMAVGYDNIDVAEATRRGVMVTNTPGVLTETTADLAFALLLAAARRLYEGQRTIVEGRWKGWSPMFMTGQDVYGATLGIVGAGRIGQAVARRARGFDMRILYHNRRPNPAFEAQVGAEYRPLDDLLREADFVVLLVPLTPETRGLIGARELALMKPTAVLVNAARGPVVDEGALYEALRTGRIWAAGLDVFDREPVAPDHPLLSLPNVTAVPHIGSATVRTRTRMAVLAAENLLAGVTGRRPSNLVNPEVFGG
ncbi:glyoxylate reductase [Symbiobacterium terraclitae]|uniref:Glyoxylate reductase n=1 Tax=Symbiobacterium terraclitae TaxID=557451 RepID=A0ABS4JTN2_9FIRM|nr:D-glycerate dehydrogenase [Symbiobacterium terraclitae]MBP2018888.1 glyoxylate reductase [Symbiobacterium terraclitae]